MQKIKYLRDKHNECLRSVCNPLFLYATLFNVLRTQFDIKRFFLSQKKIVSLVIILGVCETIRKY